MEIGPLLIRSANPRSQLEAVRGFVSKRHLRIAVGLHILLELGEMFLPFGIQRMQKWTPKPGQRLK